jgi:hypothetical protein
MGTPLFDAVRDVLKGDVRTESDGAGVPAGIRPDDTLSRSVLLSVNFRSFGQSRKLKESEYTVDADKSKVRASKRLLDSKEMAAIRSHDGKTRAMLEVRTLPSMFREGMYLVPIESIERIDEILSERADERTNLVLVAAGALANIMYRDSLPADQGGLGGLFRASDYPSESQLRAAYSLKWSWSEIITPTRLKGISQALFERERAKAEETWREAIAAGQAMLTEQFSELVAHLVDRLTPEADGSKKKFKDSSIEGFKLFLDTFSPRNLGGDAELQALVDRARGLMSGVSGEDLRKQEGLRDVLKAGFSEIKSAVSDMVQKAPKRQISLEDDWAAV